MITIATFYRFVTLHDVDACRGRILDVCRRQDIRGTVLLAQEGINATIAGRRDAIEEMLKRLGEDERFRGISPRYTNAPEVPFRRLKVRLKKEIVTMGVDGIDPNRIVGSYVDPAEWNELISRPEVLVIDTRNDYEVAIGAFAGAVDPETTTFRDFPAYVDAELARDTSRPVAMYCTGGIRCEKATAYLRERGFAEVYHLKGGILNYLESVEPAESLWQGDCFVFDDRIAVDASLQPGTYRLCEHCQAPVDVARDAACPMCENTSV